MEDRRPDWAHLGLFSRAIFATGFSFGHAPMPDRPYSF
jgi:hypothetical protein